MHVVQQKLEPVKRALSTTEDRCPTYRGFDTMVKNIEFVGASLLDPKVPISKKMSAVFVLKHANTSEALEWLNKGAIVFEPCLFLEI